MHRRGTPARRARVISRVGRAGVAVLAAALVPATVVAVAAAQPSGRGERPVATSASRPATPAGAHDATRPWLTKQVAERMASARVGALRPRGAVSPIRARTAVSTAASTARREVFGFAGAGSLGDPDDGYTTWNLSLLTTVAYFGLSVKASDGSLVQDDTGWSVWHSSTASDFINAAHAQGVRVLLTLIFQDFQGQNSPMCQALDHGQTTIDQAATQLMGADGIDLDYEGVNQTCPGGVTLRTKLDQFVQMVRARGLGTLVIDTYAGSPEDSGGFFDIPTLAGSVDALFVMAYGLEAGNGPCATCMGPTSPLEGSAPNYIWNVTRAANDYAPWAAETIMGFPYYGVAGCVQGPNPPANAPVISNYTADPYTTLATLSSIPTVSSLTLSRDALDPNGQEPWATFFNSDPQFQCWREAYWDDPVSLGHKYDLVNNGGFKGAGIFTLDFGGGSPELWATLAAKFGVTATGITPAGGSAMGGDSVQISGSSFQQGAKVAFGGHLATSIVTSPDGTSIAATTPSGPVGAVTVTVTNPDGSHATVPGGFTYSSPAAAGTTFLFAEGNTIPGFDEELEAFMPNSSGSAEVTYFTESGSVGPIAHAVTAGQVTAISVLSDVGAGHSGVSASVVLPGPGVVERQLHFAFNGWHGSTDKVGATAAAREWDFAEGSTLSAFSEFLTLQNPDPAADANVGITYFTGQGSPLVKSVTLPHSTRTTVQVFSGSQTSGTCTVSNGVTQDCGVGPGVVGVSARVLVTGGPDIIAERPMYVNGADFGSGPVRDGHDAFGATGPNASWNFAEGTTLNGFIEFLTLQNPGSTISNVTVRYFTDSGQTVTRTLALPATSRTTLDVTQGSTAAGPLACTISGGVAQSCGVGRGVGGVSASVTVTSGPAIVVERPMYLSVDFGSGVVAGATVVVGANSLGRLFGFAGSDTSAGHDDFLTIQNPNAQAATVTISYYDAAAGFPRTATVVVPPATRRTVLIFAAPGAGSGGVGPGFSQLGIVVSSDLPLLVERPTYSSVDSRYGATDTMGFQPSPAF